MQPRARDRLAVAGALVELGSSRRRRCCKSSYLEPVLLDSSITFEIAEEVPSRRMR